MNKFKTFSGVELFLRNMFFSRSHAHMHLLDRSFRNEWRWNIYASANRNMHGKTSYMYVGGTFRHAELELNTDFVVYISVYFMCQLLILTRSRHKK